MSARAAELRFRFRPEGAPDGIFEREGGAPIPVPAPDWDRALVLLRAINTLRNSSGVPAHSLITEEGFEPWWYTQDRLLRFYLVPLTQLFPLLEAAQGPYSLRVENPPPDFRRVLLALGGRNGFAEVKIPSVENPQIDIEGRPLRNLGSLRVGSISRHEVHDSSPLTGFGVTILRDLKGRLAWGAVLLLSLASLAALLLARRDTVFYIIDHVSPGERHDFRFAPLYREFTRRGVRFAEFAHTLSPRQALGNFFRRRRPVFFVEAADEWARLAHVGIAASPAPNALWEPDRSATPGSIERRALEALVPTVLGWCAESVSRQLILKRALKFQRARRAVIFDDNRHNHELIAACRSLGIPVLGFQHGVFNQFHAGLMAYGFKGARPHAFDRYGVWSELFRERLLRSSALYNEGNIFVAGPVRAPQDLRNPESGGGGITAPRPGRLRILVVSEPLARKNEVAPYLRAMLDDPQMEICLKLRPGESAGSLAEYGLPADRVRMLQTPTVYEALAEVDVAAGTYSTVLYEAALALVPVVWMKTSRAYGRELAEEGLAETAAEPAQMIATIRKAVDLSKEELRRRRARIWGDEVKDGAVRLVDVLEEMSAEKRPPTEDRRPWMADR